MFRNYGFTIVSKIVFPEGDILNQKNKWTF